MPAPSEGLGDTPSALSTPQRQATVPPRLRMTLALFLGALAALLIVAQLRPGTEGMGLLLAGVAAALIALMIGFRKGATVGLVAVTLLLSLALAEVLVPRVLAGPADAVHVQDAPGYWDRGDIGTQPNEGRFRTVKTLQDGGSIYDVVYTIGPDRLRITPGSAASPQRINFMGCSVTYGEGLQDHETLPAYVVQRLNGVQARNFAFHGYGPQQALAILQSQRDTQGQVHVFVTAPWHALRSACKPIWTIGSPRYQLAEGGEVRRAGFCGDGMNPWLTASLTRQLARSTVFRAVRGLALGGASDRDIELYLAIVQEMARISRDRGQRLVVGFIKADEGFFRGTRFSNALVFAELQERADDVIDLTLAARSEDVAPRYYLHELDRHPSALANQERASILIARLAPLLDLKQTAHRPPSR